MFGPCYDLQLPASRQVSAYSGSFAGLVWTWTLNQFSVSVAADATSDSAPRLQFKTNIQLTSIHTS